MELVTENVAEEKELTPYEIERDKPMPSRNHGKLQMRIGRLLLNQYESRFDIVSEPTLQMLERPRVPDLAFSMFKKVIGLMMKLKLQKFHRE